jgi:hypothetical protein
MKNLLTFLLSLLCFCSQSLSQNNPDNAIHLSKLPPEGLLLDKDWKFNVGDNLEWAKPEYDDSNWKSINPTLDIHDSLPQIPRSGVVWFRLHLLVDSAVNNQMVLMILQSGASELYLDGKLIHHFGVLSSIPEQVKAYNPHDKPVSFPVTNAPMQILAVRYDLQPDISYSTHWGIENPGLSILVNTVERANDLYEQWHINVIEAYFLTVGVLAILGILYLAFYVFYPAQKVNLYFSLFALLAAVSWSILIYLRTPHPIEQFSIINNSVLVLTVTGNYFMLTAIYNLLEQKKRWSYYSLIALGVISIPFGIFIYSWGWMICGNLFINL